MEYFIQKIIESFEMRDGYNVRLERLEISPLVM